LRRGHANLLCIVPILCNDISLSAESREERKKREKKRKEREKKKYTGFSVIVIKAG